LAFVRSYRSQWAAGTKGTAVDPGLSPAWSHNHAVSLKLEGVAGTVDSTARVMFGDGRARAFAWDVAGSSWTASNSSDSLTLGSAGLVYKNLDDDSAWQFDAEGRLLSQTLRNGWTTSYSYSTPATISSTAPIAGLLTSVSNQFGASLNFTYNTAAQLVSVGLPDGQAIGFLYSSYNMGGNLWRLDAVTYPGTSGTVSKHYVYENTNYPKLLTGIVDELGNRFATYAYDTDGRGISTQHAGGADLHTISYAAGGLVTVTDPLGTPRSYNYGTNKGKLAVTGASQPGGSTASSVQDVNGLVTQETDFLGVSTMYTWDINRRLPLTTTQAAALPEARTTSTQWHATFRLPVLVTEAGRTIAYSYDTQGNKLSQTVTDTATSVARTTSWTYNPQGLLATESNNGIVTQTYAYYGATSFTGTAPNEVGYTAGDLQSITNAVGHVTQFTLYDRVGRVRQMVDPKGVATDTVYTPRGWVSSTSVTPPGGTARTTTYGYDNAGQLTGVVMPDTTTMSYSYDLAHRLIGVTDAKGNTVTYTLDAMGNKVGEQVKDSSNNLQRNITRVYDALNRVQQVTGASN
jgi:YD repeat-containing protein